MSMIRSKPAYRNMQWIDWAGPSKGPVTPPMRRTLRAFGSPCTVWVAAPWATAVGVAPTRGIVSAREVLGHPQPVALPDALITDGIHQFPHQENAQAANRARGCARRDVRRWQRSGIKVRSVVFDRHREALCEQR